ncbi:MAG TPA: carboxypeptidase-like regulatory domain-containing protein [Pyrinomonadaceae bacterium]|nr:carboxypeptidase-like regulatory domain-containing protein [Pyrinomonadaceae bacterium]
MKQHIIAGGLLIAVATLVVAAQTGSATASGKLSGLVVDLGGAVVPRAKIVAEAGELRRETISGDDGRYEMALPPGKYLVTIARDDFWANKVLDVTVAANALTKLDVVMTKGIEYHEERYTVEPLPAQVLLLNPAIQMRKLRRIP